MTLRARFFTASIQILRIAARALGCEIVIETSQHSLKTSFEVPDKSKRAWDPNLFKHGNLFHAQYANPIKPVVRTNQELEQPDNIALEESDAPAADGSGEGEDSKATDGPHTTLISSGRYRTFMRQNLISELLTPREQWRLLAYGILALGLLQLFSLIMILFTNGTF